MQGSTHAPGSSRLKTAASLLFLLGLAVWSFPNLFTGRRPLVYDHVLHFVKASQLRSFLAEGRIYGWSDMWFAGYPAGFHYPIGAELGIAAFDLATFGLFDFATVYLLAVTFALFFQGFAVYHLATRLGHRTAGLVAAFVLMTHYGYTFTGGWYWHVKIGVWPCMFAVSCGIAALAHMPLVGAPRRWYDVGTFALLMGVSLVCHPLMLLFWPLALAAGLALGGKGRSRAERLDAWRALAVGVACGSAIGALWVLPFVSAKATAETWGLAWLGARDMARRLADGTLFQGTPALVVGLGGLGIVATIAAADARARVVSGVAVFGLVAACSSLHALIDLVKHVPLVRHVQFDRFAIFVKPLIVLLGARTLVVLLVAVAREVPARRSARVAAGAFAVALAAGWLVGYAEATFLRDPSVAAADPDAPDYARLAAWLKERREASPGETYRVAADFPGPGRDHHLSDLPALTGTPLFKFDYTSASGYRHKIADRKTDRGLAASLLELRYFVGYSDVAPAGFKPAATFGVYRVFEREGPLPRGYATDPPDLEVATVERATELLVVDKKDARPGHWIVHRGYFDRWHAYHDGVEIPVAGHDVPGLSSGRFLSIPVAAPGRYTLRYETGKSEIMGFVLALLGLAGAVAALLRKRLQ